MAKIIELARQVQNPARADSYPVSLSTSARRPLYDDLGNDEALALNLDSEIRRTKKDGWRGNKIKEREVLYVAESSR